MIMTESNQNDPKSHLWDGYLKDNHEIGNCFYRWINVKFLPVTQTFMSYFQKRAK